MLFSLPKTVFLPGLMQLAPPPPPPPKFSSTFPAVPFLFPSRSCPFPLGHSLPCLSPSLPFAYPPQRHHMPINIHTQDRHPTFPWCVSHSPKPAWAFPVADHRLIICASGNGDGALLGSEHEIDLQEAASAAAPATKLAVPLLLAPCRPLQRAVVAELKGLLSLGNSRRAHRTSEQQQQSAHAGESISTPAAEPSRPTDRDRMVRAAFSMALVDQLLGESA